ncbi:hypothetical protein ES703_00832 [subsurface metagenome]
MVGIEQKKKYIKWYRLAQQAINDESIIPELTDEQVMGLVSDENWLPIASPEIDKLMSPEDVKEKVRKSKHPHIRIYLEDQKIGIGLLFNTVASIDKLKNILTPYFTEEKKKLVQLLCGLDEGYETLLYKKTKTTCPVDSPDYEEILDPTVTNRIDDEFVTQMFRKLKIVRQEGIEEIRKRKERGEWYWRGVAVHLAEVEINKNEGEYKRRVRELVEIYKVCAAVKTDTQIRRIKKNEAKEIERFRERKKTLELLCRLPWHPQYRGAVKELEEVKRRLKELEARGENIGV